MSTLAYLGEGLERAWESLAEGWQQLRERASQAITRFQPHRKSEGVGSVEDELMRRAMRWGVVAAELEERDDEIIVRLEAPGLEPADFDISVVNGVLQVRGEKRMEREQKRGRYHVMERAYGSFERSIPLPRNVEASGVKARYRRGVLTVRLPIAESARVRRIEVQE
ncbi:MAG TPA: Hsp20/alpha crystallin family protein [Gammaproteobacteria bacterium]|nr:Hsp20/alpha crystallin family protein [Gammaproteobacteria bacterium]